MTRQQFLEMLQRKMPLPILGFARKRRGDHIRYVIGLDATGVSAVESNELTISFKLSADASREELAAAVDGAARAVRRKIMPAPEMPSLPGTSLTPNNRSEIP